MSLFDPPSCPQCLSEVPLGQLWKVARTDRNNLLVGNVGIVCPACGAKLRVTQGRAKIGAVISLALFFGGIIFLSEFIRRLEFGSATIVVVVAVVGAFFFLLSRMIPRLARLRFLEPREVVKYPLEEDREQRENDAADVDGDDNVEPADRLTKESWICPKCGQDNPPAFEICWSCQAIRPTADASNSK